MDWIWSIINVLGLSWLFVCIVVFIGRRISYFISFIDRTEHDLKKLVYINMKVTEFDKRIERLEKQLEEDK